MIASASRAIVTGVGFHAATADALCSSSCRACECDGDVLKLNIGAQCVLRLTEMGVPVLAVCHDQDAPTHLAASSVGVPGITSLVGDLGDAHVCGQVREYVAGGTGDVLLVHCAGSGKLGVGGGGDEVPGVATQAKTLSQVLHALGSEGLPTAVGVAISVASPVTGFQKLARGIYSHVAPSLQFCRGIRSVAICGFADTGVHDGAPYHVGTYLDLDAVVTPLCELPANLDDEEVRVPAEGGLALAGYSEVLLPWTIRKLTGDTAHVVSEESLLPEAAASGGKSEAKCTIHSQTVGMVTFTEFQVARKAWGHEWFHHLVVEAAQKSNAVVVDENDDLLWRP